MEPCGALWSRVEPYEALWSCMEPCGALWNLVEPYGALWSIHSISLVLRAKDSSWRRSLDRLLHQGNLAVAASVSVGGAVEVLRNISISSDVVVVIIVVVIPLGENPKVVWPSLPSLGRLAG